MRVGESCRSEVLARDVVLGFASAGTGISIDNVGKGGALIVEAE